MKLTLWRRDSLDETISTFPYIPIKDKEREKEQFQDRSSPVATPTQ